MQKMGERYSLIPTGKPVGFTPQNYNAELIFVNSNSFGVEINGSLRHIYIDELKEMFETEE